MKNWQHTITLKPLVSLAILMLPPGQGHPDTPTPQKQKTPKIKFKFGVFCFSNEKRGSVLTEKHLIFKFSFFDYLEKAGGYFYAPCTVIFKPSAFTTQLTELSELGNMDHAGETTASFASRLKTMLKDPQKRKLTRI